MKKLSAADRKHQQRTARLRLKQHRKRRDLHYDQGVRSLALRREMRDRAHSLGVRPPSDWYRYPIALPEVLSLRENYSATVKVINDLREMVLVKNRPVQLYFDHVATIEPAAALLLTAEVFRCRHLRTARQGQMVTGTYPKSAEVFLQLREMGFYKVMEVNQFEDEFPDTRERADRPFFLRFQSLKFVMAEAAAKLVDLIASTSVNMSLLSKRRMVGALKEAMGNAVEHAYDERGEFQTMNDRYWMTGYVNPATNEAMIIILDQGVGIPKTLGPTRFEQIRAFLKFEWQPSDGYMIAAATELHRTSTGQRGRGKGFRDMKRFIDSCDDGELRVLSNGGCYRYMKGGQQVTDEDLSIGGTLIEWRVKHEETVEIAR